MAKAMAEAKAELEAVEGGKAQVEIPLGLSPRESEIFTLLLTEAAPKDIAYNLNISNSAVNKHILNIYRKLNVQSRVELFAKFSSQSIKNG
uniref:HTH luxR-type domain-containing protein n=1 Tax=uncultured bacterium contig00094 TaxID=1181565 RepID=A0A806KGY2_9BACT|nr:hypothetical protein [uncultured bacterium contig00094]